MDDADLSNIFITKISAFNSVLYGIIFFLCILLEGLIFSKCKRYDGIICLTIIKTRITNNARNCFVTQG